MHLTAAQRVRHAVGLPVRPRRSRGRRTNLRTNLRTSRRSLKATAALVVPVVALGVAVTASADHPEQGPTAGKCAAPPAGSYQWVATDWRGNPASWSGPIPYRVLLTADTPSGGPAFVDRAVAVVSKASGGTVTFRRQNPVTGAPDGDLPGVTIIWDATHDWPARVAGQATPGVAVNGTYSSGTVWLRPGEPFSSDLRFGAPESLGPVLVHELGHAVGLGHTADPGADSLMTAQRTERTTLTRTDGRALRFLATGTWCPARPAPRAKPSTRSAASTTAGRTS